GKIQMGIDASTPAGIDTTTSYEQHDHVFVVNHQNKVRWFFYKESYMKELQDPEWSLNGKYMAMLASYTASTKAWAGYAVKMSDKSILKIYDSGLAETSDPCLWVGDSVARASVIDTLGKTDSRIHLKSDITAFFGTSNVKYVYLMIKQGVRHLYFVDYSQALARPDTVRLAKPTDMLSENSENPIVSPDGKWVTYHIGNSTSGYRSYVQELQRGSEPILVSNGATFPRFWKQGDGATFIVYAKYPDDPFVLTKYNATTYGTFGDTYIQEVRISSDGPTALRFRFFGEPSKLIGFPMKGGLTSSGSSIVTGYAYAYVFKFN
ncbi:MAG: hypothetical protein JNL74_05190, partial [Fibrobacteres bacterium]|nr:hypothetical protein [Fibrobacterota bacterium]